ncbi:hypothetical protein [Moorena sp. SIOASIH]|uniref:hypothetical protein n=1 Tax=Moorena sp. SIOASIH TaxID=2607817 RepID=UPI0025DF57C6|nr:hypothetical protein [Moorena sp. SIOASIH]
MAELLSREQGQECGERGKMGRWGDGEMGIIFDKRCSAVLGEILRYPLQILETFFKSL